MSETTQMQALPITISAEEFVGLTTFLLDQPARFSKSILDFLDTKQRHAQQDAQQAEAERARSASTAELKSAAKKK